MMTTGRSSTHRLFTIRGVHAWGKNGRCRRSAASTLPSPEILPQTVHGADPGIAPSRSNDPARISRKAREADPVYLSGVRGTPDGFGHVFYPVDLDREIGVLLGKSPDHDLDIPDCSDDRRVTAAVSEEATGDVSIGDPDRARHGGRSPSGRIHLQ
jgi:hypothetical protein